MIFLLYSFSLHMYRQFLFNKHFLKINRKKLRWFEFCEIGAFDSLTEDIYLTIFLLSNYLSYHLFILQSILPFISILIFILQPIYLTIFLSNFWPVRQKYNKWNWHFLSLGEKKINKTLDRSLLFCTKIFGFEPSNIKDSSFSNNRQ